MQVVSPALRHAVKLAAHRESSLLVLHVLAAFTC